MNMIHQTLDQLRPGENAQIVSVDPTDLTDRMSDLGLTAGATVCCELISLLGDPMAFRVVNGNLSDASCIGQSMIALRKKDARSVHLIRTDAESRALWD